MNPMDENERVLADCRASWHDEAAAEADRMGLQGTKREEFIKAHIAEREKV